MSKTVQDWWQPTSSPPPFTLHWSHDNHSLCVINSTKINYWLSSSLRLVTFSWVQQLVPEIPSELAPCVTWAKGDKCPFRARNKSKYLVPFRTESTTDDQLKPCNSVLFFCFVFSISLCNLCTLLACFHCKAFFLLILFLLRQWHLYHIRILFSWQFLWLFCCCLLLS